MGWVRLDDGFAQHPKVLRLADRSFRLYVEALCYASTYLTDGQVPAAWVGNRGRDALQLVKAGLWDRESGGFVIHDYLTYNPSKADSNAKRIAARKAAASRWSNARKGTGREVLDREGELSRFAEFWSAFPIRKDRAAAERAWADAIEQADPDTIIAGAERYAEELQRPDAPKGKYAQGWLHASRWEDEPAPALNGSRLHKVADDMEAAGL